MSLEPEQDRLLTHHDLAAWLILIKVCIFLSLVLSLLFFFGGGFVYTVVHIILAEGWGFIYFNHNILQCINIFAMCHIRGKI